MALAFASSPASVARAEPLGAIHPLPVALATPVPGPRQPASSTTSTTLELPSRALPVLTILAGGSIAFLGFISIPLADLCAISDRSDACHDRDRNQTIAALVGVAGLGVGIAGIVWLVAVNHERDEVERRILESIAHRPPVSVVASASSVGLQLDLRF